MMTNHFQPQLDLAGTDRNDISSFALSTPDSFPALTPVMAACAADERASFSGK
jgi:hypothetical protein